MDWVILNFGLAILNCLKFENYFCINTLQKLWENVGLRRFKITHYLIWKRLKPFKLFDTFAA
jgi:hypothetical protein